MIDYPRKRQWRIFNDELGLALRNNDLKSTVLGTTDGLPIVLVEPKEQLLGKPSILVAAGFHGDEPAGVWGVLRFIRESLVRYTGLINLSFLPLVNPTGFCDMRRTNHRGQDPNRGFCHTASGLPEVSEEGDILLASLDRLSKCGKDGFLSLHEDSEETRFYLYAFELTRHAGPVSRVLRDAEAHWFEPYPDGEFEGSVIREGVIYCRCDGSFEDFLFHRGVPSTACTETPGMADIEMRVLANVLLIQALADLVIGS